MKLELRKPNLAAYFCWFSYSSITKMEAKCPSEKIMLPQDMAGGSG
jgi:hypothetical protein